MKNRFHKKGTVCYNLCYDVGVKTLITDCFVLRTSTILPRIRNHKIKNNEIFQQRRHV